MLAFERLSVKVIYTFLGRIDSEGVSPIVAVLKELKGWPLIKEYVEYEPVAHWQDLHLFYTKISVFPLFEISVNNDALKRTNTILVSFTFP